MKNKAEEQKAPGTLRRLLGNVVVFVVLIALTFWLIFKDQDVNQLMDVLGTVNMWYIGLAALVMLLYFLMEAWNIKTILGSFGEKISIWKALKFTMVGFFFCSITPGASGGQPIEIYYMTKEKISGAKATVALLVQLCGFQISVMVIGVICAAMMMDRLDGPILWLFIIGLLINGIALVLILMCIFSQKLTRKLVSWFIRILKKIGFKKAEKYRRGAEEGLEQYGNSAIYIKQHRLEFIKSIAKVMVQVSLYYVIPFCIYKAFGLVEHGLLEIFMLQSVLFVATSGLPLPGAVGVSETVFLGLYGAVFGKELLSSAMLLNRGVNFYLYVLICLFVVIGNIIWLKRTKQNVMEE